MDWNDATCWLDGEWLPLTEARVPVLDRGFLFGDGVYEVIPVDTVDGIRAPFRLGAHFARLQRSLDGTGIANPLGVAAWTDLVAAMIDRHPWPRQSVYLQVTRGVARRDHAFPAGVRPTTLMWTGPWPHNPADMMSRGVAAVTHADERWLHCDIKSVALLGNVLMKQYAVERGALEVVMFRDGLLTEGSSTNIFAVRNGVLLAPPPSHLILRGITYDAVVDLARAHGMAVELRAVTEAEVRGADELWITSSGREAVPITTLDGAPVGAGVPGPWLQKMLGWYHAAKQADARAWAASRAAVRPAAAIEGALR